MSIVSTIDRILEKRPHDMTLRELATTLYPELKFPGRGRKPNYQAIGFRYAQLAKILDEAGFPSSLKPVGKAHSRARNDLFVHPRKKPEKITKVGKTIKAQLEFEKGRREGLKQAARWCGSQASALYHLKRENAARLAFVEAHNTLLALAEGTLDDRHRIK